MDRNDQLLLGALTIASIALVLVAVATTSTPTAATAAWVQAVFSIAGIGVAIAVPAAIATSERKERALLRYQRTCSLTTTLLGAIWLLEAETIRVGKSLLSHKDEPPNSLNWKDWFAEIRSDIPEELTSSLPLMYDMLEEIIGPTRQSAMMAMTFNGYVARFSQLNRAKAVTEWNTLFAQIDGQFKLLGQAIAQAQGIVLQAYVKTS